MSDEDTGVEGAPADSASAHLIAALEPHRSSRIAKTARTVAALVLSIVSGGSDPDLSTTDLVVTRRSTGNEVLRVSAGTLLEGDRLLQVVRRDLETKSVSDFLREWRHIDED